MHPDERRRSWEREVADELRRLPGWARPLWRYLRWRTRPLTEAELDRLTRRLQWLCAALLVSILLRALN